MHLSSFISPDSVIPSLKVKTKKQLLQELSARAARLTGVPERDIFDVLLQRERLGSTGLGQGIAIPHGKLAGLKRIVGIFARLAEPVDFDAVDGDKVDIVFLLLAPEGAGADHLKALARISRLLREGSAVDKLRASKDAAALYAVLTEDEASSHAASRGAISLRQVTRWKRQCTLTGTRSFSMALAMAALRLSVSASGVPSAPSTA
jgi:PTS system nitrogen regulatory IIA component